MINFLSFKIKIESIFVLLNSNIQLKKKLKKIELEFIQFIYIILWSSWGALWGHKNTSVEYFSSNDNRTSENQGNFKKLLRFRLDSSNNMFKNNFDDFLDQLN